MIPEDRGPDDEEDDESYHLVSVYQGLNTTLGFLYVLIHFMLTITL